MLSGDSHANWAADLTWVDGPEVPEYSPSDGSGAVGVEFAGTAVSAQSIVCSSFSDTGPASLSIPECNEVGQSLIADNEVLQWTEGYYRGYYELHISASSLQARYFGTPTVAANNGFEVSLANFTVESGANRISRPIGSVENGAVRGGGDVRVSNITIDTQNPERGYFVHDERQMYLVVEASLLGQ